MDKIFADASERSKIIFDDKSEAVHTLTLQEAAIAFGHSQPPDT